MSPGENYKYGTCSIYKRGDSSIIVVLYGDYLEAPMSINYRTSDTWTEWKSYVTNGNLLRYKSYEFTDSSYSSDTITNMIEHYWSNIANNTYGLVTYSNYSSIWIGTYAKYNNEQGEITINGLSNSYPFQKGVLTNAVWHWSSIITNNDLQKSFAQIDINRIITTYFGYCTGCTNTPPVGNGYLEVYHSITSPN